jgi:hypothetical protein
VWLLQRFQPPAFDDRSPDGSQPRCRCEVFSVASARPCGCTRATTATAPSHDDLEIRNPARAPAARGGADDARGTRRPAEGALRLARPGAAVRRRHERPRRAAQRELDRGRQPLLVPGPRRRRQGGDQGLRPRHRPRHHPLLRRGNDLPRRQRALCLRELPVGAGLAAPGVPDALRAHLPPLRAGRLLRVLAGRPLAATGHARRRHRAALAQRRDARLRARRRHVRDRPGHACRAPAHHRRHRARLQRPLRLGLRGGVRPGAGVELVARQPPHRLLAGGRARRAHHPDQRPLGVAPEVRQHRLSLGGRPESEGEDRRGRRAVGAEDLARHRGDGRLLHPPRLLDQPARHARGDHAQPRPQPR